ncbi:MAG: ATP-binding cassette domain-containing protein [Acidobacteriota bacterium]
MIEVTNATKRYGDQVAIDDLDMSIERGRTTVLLGTSGSGKSTLLRLFLGLELPDTGIVRFAGRPLNDGATPHRDAIHAARLTTGYVIQEGGLFPHLTARANIALAARHRGWTRARIEQRLDELVVVARFPSDGLDRYPNELSGGQRQRVALMRALMLDPSVLLLDEPLGALDPITRYELQDELRTLFDTLGKTVVLVTHSVEEAAYFADDIVLLASGRMIQRGDLESLRVQPATPYVERFLQARRSLPSPPVVHARIVDEP